MPLKIYVAELRLNLEQTLHLKIVMQNESDSFRSGVYPARTAVTRPFRCGGHD